MITWLKAIFTGTWFWPVATSLISASLAGSAGFFIGHSKGVDAGREHERALQSDQTVRDMNLMLTAHKELVNESTAAGKALRTAATVRANADAKSLKDLRDALASTAPERADCVFDADIVQRLNAARDAAAQAATAGLRATVPSTSSADSK